MSRPKAGEGEQHGPFLAADDRSRTVSLHNWNHFRQTWRIDHVHEMAHSGSCLGTCQALRNSRLSGTAPGIAFSMAYDFRKIRPKSSKPSGISAFERFDPLKAFD
jgi:hypothetical protein